MQTKIYKMTKFGENRPISKQDQPFESGKIRKEMYVSDSVRCPYISLLILTFLNHYISLKTGQINTKLGDFVNLSVLFLTKWINSWKSYNLQTPSWFENRQCLTLIIVVRFRIH